MSFQNIFKRYETKYLITREQQQALLKAVSRHIRPDEYGNSTICNVYYDTPDFLLIRRSLEKPVYKEKLRLRSYGVARENTTVFAEIKKKYDGVVYKRRINTNEANAFELCKGVVSENPSQIEKEILYLTDRYKGIEPKVFLSYEREAFYAKDDEDFRITFDKNILWRDWDVNLHSGVYGSPILLRNQVLMEVKCAGAMPLWFVKVLTDNGLYKTSFSKYGRAYESICRRDLGGKIYA